jgi:hypothetical protein
MVVADGERFEGERVEVLAAFDLRAGVVAGGDAGWEGRGLGLRDEDEAAGLKFGGGGGGCRGEFGVEVFLRCAEVWAGEGHAEGHLAAVDVGGEAADGGAVGPAGALARRRACCVVGGVAREGDPGIV